MSRASATITFLDGHQLFTLYDGTSDILWSHLVDTSEEAWGDLRDRYYRAMRGTGPQLPPAECTCGRDEPATVNEDYGCGDEWISWACRYCKVMTGRLIPYGYEEPEWP